METNRFTRNEFDQPIGLPTSDSEEPLFPENRSITGNYCELSPLKTEHANELYQVLGDEGSNKNWTYLTYGPFKTETSFVQWIQQQSQSKDPQFYTIISKKNQKPVGLVSFLRISPSNGSIEIGHIHFSNALQKTRGATEAIYLLMKIAFDLGYRRLEWKCDALNEPSRKAAIRFGFTYEGIFRNATTYKGRNRDTAWFSIIDTEWPQINEEFVRWLSDLNFDSAGRQRSRLQCRSQ